MQFKKRAQVSSSQLERCFFYLAKLNQSESWEAYILLKINIKLNEVL